jgi:O-antigen ligase
LDTYGPFGNRHHFAGCLVMAINLALGLALEALQRLTSAWGAKRRGWLALGGPEAAAFVRRLAVALLLLAGLVTSKSRGGVVAWAASAPVLVLALRRRLLAAVVIGLLVVLVVTWVGIGDVVEGFQKRGIKASRVDLWEDMFRMFPQFPLFGVGWDAFGMAYRRHQTVWRYYFVGEAHNEYLQVLLELGIFGFPIVAALFFVLFRRAFAAASRSPLEAGILASLLGLAFHNLVDFNWQIPASAATYVALAGLAMRGSGSLDPSHARI